MGKIIYRNYKTNRGVSKSLVMPTYVHCPLCGVLAGRPRVRHELCPLWRHMVRTHGMMMHRVPPFLCVCGELFTGERIKDMGTYEGLSYTPTLEWMYMHVPYLTADELNTHIIQRSMGVQYIAADRAKQKCMEDFNKDNRGAM